MQWFSESDVSDIVESDSTPASPVTVLEAVDGVQPELQHTQKESELVSKSSLNQHQHFHFLSLPFLQYFSFIHLVLKRKFLLQCNKN